MSADAVPDFTNGPDSYTLPAPFTGNPGLSTTFDMRTSGQGFLLAPLTRYGIVLVPLKDSASAGMAVVLPALATTLGVSDLGSGLAVPGVERSPYSHGPHRNNAQPSSTFPTTAKPAAAISSSQPTAAKPATAKPAAAISSSSQPTAAKPATAKPAAAISASSQPTSTFPATAISASSQPTSTCPATAISASPLSLAAASPPISALPLSSPPQTAAPKAQA
ncbi:hypothetical protein D9Q98_002346 [Chlorella vulgaris]|uniref:Uncharacterized protein n=1 Tax=Chlorella vulgaris TaxID=3077 RepID=A0A9D4TW79_CHLVU|nr:hypothetical protein D9Q98_002346 [Chlorella vulgaris]